MTTTAIDTNTVNTVGDGFDLVANGDVLFVTPGVSLGSVEAAGVFADSGGYVFNDGDIFAINEGILLNADSNTGQFSEGVGSPPRVLCKVRPGLESLLREVHPRF